MFKLGISGATGRTGKNLIELVNNDFKESFTLHSLGHRSTPPDIHGGADVLIDFSTPESLKELIKVLLSLDSPPSLVIGTTGLSLEHEEGITALSKKTQVLYSANFSVGISILKGMLLATGNAIKHGGYKATIEETHHIHKKDAPSGTALAIEETLRKIKVPTEPTLSHRTGDVVGLHTVNLASEEDQISITHEAHTRKVFARGALFSALQLMKQKHDPSKKVGRFYFDDLVKDAL